MSRFFCSLKLNYLFLATINIFPSFRRASTWLIDIFSHSFFFLKQKKLGDRLLAFFFIRYFLAAVHKNKQKSPPYCLLEKYLLLWISIDLLPERL